MKHGTKARGAIFTYPNSVTGVSSRFFQARIVALNSHYFLKNGGHCVISIKASCVDSTASPEAVFAQEVG